MELIDRYLQAVKLALPKAQQDDIIKELSDSLLSQIEDKQAELGRPLNEEEQVALLQKMGSPAVLAGRYRKQQYLIGPGLLPTYWQVLRLALSVTLIVSMVASIATVAAGKPILESLAPIFHFPMAAASAFTWVTVIFAIVEFFGAGASYRKKTGRVWDPRKLPPLVKAERGKSRAELVAGMVIGVLASVWWLAALRHPFLVFGPGVAFLTFSPVWLRIYPLFVLAALSEVARYGASLVWPHAARLHDTVRFLGWSVSLSILCLLARAGEVFAVQPAAASPRLEGIMASVNYSAHLTLIILAIVLGVVMLRNLVRLIGGRIVRSHNATLAC